MSFFIRKKSRNGLTQSLASSSASKKLNEKSKGPKKQTERVDKKGKLNNKQGRKNLKRKGPQDVKGTGAKKSRPTMDDEITSESEIEDELETVNGQTNEQMSSEYEDEEETAQEKKLRLAKSYLDQLQAEEKSQKEDLEIDDDLIATRLKDDVLEQEGRLRKEVADLVEPDLENMSLLTCPKYLKRSVTCLCVSEDDQWIFSGSKDGVLIKWSVEEKRKVGMVKRLEKMSKKKKRLGKVVKPQDENCCHATTISAIAISSDGKFLATGDLDNQVVIWDPKTLKRIHIFKGHRGAIYGLVFKKKTHTLYSCSADKTVRIWSLDDMGWVETLFGHQDTIYCLDALSRDRAISGGGSDHTIRVWKIVEESQLIYNGHYDGSIDTVKLVNEENFISGGSDGLLCTWNVNRKRPMFTMKEAHGKKANLPNWITVVSAWVNTDLIASGSSDGQIRFWKCGEKFHSLSESFTVPCEGWINTMEFSAAPDIGKRPKFLVVGVGREHKLGRWGEDISCAKNSIAIIPLKRKIGGSSKVA